MIKHEQKICQRCNVAFECKVGSISLCQCNGIHLKEDERSYVNEHFHDCLCANCLNEIKNELQRKRFIENLEGY